MNRNVVGIIGSITVHLIVIVAFFLTPTPPLPQKAEPPFPTDDTPTNVTLLMDEAEMSNGMGISNQPLTFDGNPCPPGAKTYLGVGISYNQVTGQIEQAPSAHPAYKAGIRVGDLLVNNPYPDENNMMHLNIIQGNHQQTLSIKATQICYLLEPLS